MTEFAEKYLNTLNDLDFKKIFTENLDEDSLKYYRDLKIRLTQQEMKERKK